MGGGYPTSGEGGEFNLDHYGNAAERVINTWPGRAVFGGYELGQHPVKNLAYLVPAAPIATVEAIINEMIAAPPRAPLSYERTSTDAGSGRKSGVESRLPFPRCYCTAWKGTFLDIDHRRSCSHP